MRKILTSVLLFILLSIGSLLLSKSVSAAGCQVQVKINQSAFDPNFNFYIQKNQDIFSTTFNGQVTLYTDRDCFSNQKGKDGKTPEYRITAYKQGTNPSYDFSKNIFASTRTDGTKSITFPINLTSRKLGPTFPEKWVLSVCLLDKGEVICPENSPRHMLTTSFTISINAPATADVDLPKVDALRNQCVYQSGSEIELTFDNLKPKIPYRWWWRGEKTVNSGQIFAISDIDPTQKFTIPSDETQELGIRTFCLDIERGVFLGPDRAGRCNPGYPNSVTLKFVAAPPEGDTTCTNAATGQQNPDLSDGPPPPCGDEIKNPKGEVIKCAAVETALGPIETDPAGFIKSIFSLLLGVSGGIAVILIIVSGYRLMASQGNPEQVQGAREMLTSAIVGLLFIIFSFVILQVIGVDILKIPGFSP